MSEVVGVILMPNAAICDIIFFLHNVSCTSSGYDDRWMTIMQIRGYTVVNQDAVAAGCRFR